VTIENHLVAFVRMAQIGRVKSRLAKDIGAVEAWRFYRNTLRTILPRLDGSGAWRRWLAVTPDRGIHAPGVWPPGWSPIAQGEGDLGQRMTRVVRALPPGPAVVVGSDVPDLTCRHVREAFRLLGRHDAVLGPALDGGYWLVGLRRRPRMPDLFSGVRWSTPHALHDTLANLRSGSFALLDTLDDIDDRAAFERWRRTRERGTTSAPRPQ
jgi:hypothetical protein